MDESTADLGIPTDDQSSQLEYSSLEKDETRESCWIGFRYIAEVKLSETMYVSSSTTPN